LLYTSDNSNQIVITDLPSGNQTLYIPIIAPAQTLNENGINEITLTVKLKNCEAEITKLVKFKDEKVTNVKNGNGFLELTYHADTNELTEAWDGEASTGTKIDFTAETVEIHDAADLKALADYVNNGNALIGQTVKLMNDIDLNNKAWTPIGSGEKSFKGIFDGNGYTIENLKVSAERAGLFAVLWSAEVKNLTLRNVNVSGKEAGCLAAVVNGNNYATTVITDVTIENSNVEKLVGTVYATTKANPLMKVDEVYYVDKQGVLKNTVEGTNGALNIQLAEGEYVLPYVSDRTINLMGQNKNSVMKMPQTAHNDNHYNGSILSFENVTLRGVGYNGQQNGYVQSASETYTDCTFETYYMFAGDKVKVLGCTLNNGMGKGADGSEAKQHIWTGSASEIEFNGCTFNLDEEGVKVLSIGNAEEKRNVTFDTCEFVTKGDNDAVLRFDSNQANSKYAVDIKNCSKSEGFDKWIEDKKEVSDKYDVTFDGVQGVYVTTNAQLKSALSNVSSKGNIILEDGIYDGLFEFDSNKTVTLKALNKQKAIIDGEFGVAGSGTVNLYDLTFRCEDFSKNYKNQYLNRSGNYIISIYVGNINVDGCKFETTIENTGAIHQYAANSTKLIVKNSVFESNGNYTLRTRGNVTVENCTFDGMVRQCLQVNSNPGYEQNTVFINNKISNADKGVMGVSIANNYEVKGMTFNVGGNHDRINNISYDKEKSSNILPYLDSHTFTGEIKRIVEENEL